MQNKVFVGSKKLKIYCGVALLHLFSNEEAQICARGEYISKAVSVATRLHRIFQNVTIKSIETSSETFLDEQSLQRHVSAIAITIGISEGHYPLIKSDQLNLEIENGSCFIHTREGNDTLFDLPLFLSINDSLVDFRKFKPVEKDGKICRKIPTKLLSLVLNKINFLVFNKNEILQRNVPKLPSLKIVDASKFIFDKKLKVSFDEQIMEKIKDANIKFQIDGTVASIEMKKLAQKDLFEIGVLNDINFDEEHNLRLWIESEGVVSSDGIRIKIPSFKPKLENQYILGNSYRVTTPELIAIPIEVTASIPGVMDELIGENELDLSPFLTEYVRKTQGEIDEVQVKARIAHRKYVGKETVKNIRIRLPDPELKETYTIGSSYEVEIRKDIPIEKVEVKVSLIDEKTELPDTDQIDLSIKLLEFVEKNHGLKDSIIIKSKSVYGKITSDEREKEVKILLPSPEIEFPTSSVLRKTKERFVLAAQDSSLKMKIIGPDFLEKDNVTMMIDELLNQVLGHKGNFEVDLYDALKLNEENILRCKFEYGKLSGEVTYRIVREPFGIEILQKIIAFQNFSLRITCDHSLIGEKLYLLGNEIEIPKTDFEVELVAGEPGEYLHKITTSREGVPEKEISLKIFPYLYAENEEIYNKAVEKFQLKLHTDRSITKEEIESTFSQMKIKGEKQKYELEMESLELLESREKTNIWKIDYDISSVFPSEYEVGPFSIEKNGVTSTTENQSSVIVDIDKLEMDNELTFGSHIQKATILPKNSTTFFDESYDKDFDKFALRMEIIRKSPLVHRLVISNPRELHYLNEYLDRAFAYGPGKYEIQLFVKNRSLFKEKITLYGVFLRENALFIGHPCRIHIFAESDIKLELDGTDIPVERVGEYYHICSILPKREGKVKLEVKVRGKSIFRKLCSVRPVERTSISKVLEEVLEDKNIFGSFLMYDKNIDKVVSDGDEFLRHLEGIHKDRGLKGIILHPLFALNEDCKDVLFNSIYKLNKNVKQLRVGFISLPTLYGGRILSQKIAEKVDFVPLVQMKCEKCGERTTVLTKGMNRLEVSCTNCETVNPEKDALQIVNLPEIFRCPECGKSWLLPCFSPGSTNSKIVLICPVCSTEIDYCYFTIEEFEESLPDILILSDKRTEWLRENHTYLLEQRTLLCNSCGRTHPVCLLFQVADYERTLDEIRYNWNTIRQDISDFIVEQKKLKRRKRRLRQIGILKRIKETEDTGILQLLEKTSLDEKLNKDRLAKLLEAEHKILKKHDELEAQLEQVSRSFLKRFFYLLRKTLRIDKRESELATLSQKLEGIKKQKEGWFAEIKDMVDREIETLKKELRKLPRTKYQNLDSLSRALQTKIESLTTPEQRKLVEIMKKLGIITKDYKLKEDALNNLVIESRCFYCGGKVQSLPPLSFLIIACHDSVLVSDDLLPFTVGKERFINDFYLYKQLL